jgi:hypothetical protein
MVGGWWRHRRYLFVTLLAPLLSIRSRDSPAQIVNLN